MQHSVTYYTEVSYFSELQMDIIHYTINTKAGSTVSPVAKIFQIN